MKTEYYLLENEDGLQMAVISCPVPFGSSLYHDKKFEERIKKAVVDAYDDTEIEEDNLICGKIKWNENYIGEVGLANNKNWEENFTLTPIELY